MKRVTNPAKPSWSCVESRVQPEPGRRRRQGPTGSETPAEVAADRLCRASLQLVVLAQIVLPSVAPLRRAPLSVRADECAGPSRSAPEDQREDEGQDVIDDAEHQQRAEHRLEGRRLSATSIVASKTPNPPGAWLAMPTRQAKT